MTLILSVDGKDWYPHSTEQIYIYGEGKMKLGDRKPGASEKADDWEYKYHNLTYSVFNIIFSSLLLWIPDGILRKDTQISVICNICCPRKM